MNTLIIIFKRSQSFEVPLKRNFNLVSLVYSNKVHLYGLHKGSTNSAICTWQTNCKFNLYSASQIYIARKDQLLLNAFRHCFLWIVLIVLTEVKRVSHRLNLARRCTSFAGSRKGELSENFTLRRILRYCKSIKFVNFRINCSQSQQRSQPENLLPLCKF